MASLEKGGIPAKAAASAPSKPAAPAKKDDDDDIDLFGSDDEDEEAGKLQLPIAVGLDLFRNDCCKD